MKRQLRTVFCAAMVILSVGASALPAAANAEEASSFVVIGLADNDQLNLRATASANGMLIGRVPNGALVQNHGCAEVNGTRWCKVSDNDNPTLMGWAAERYLQPAEAEYSEPADPDPVDESGEEIGPVEGETPPG